MSGTSAGKNVIVQGRLLSVWGGNLWKGSAKTDDRTKQPVIDPKTQQPIMEYGFILAFPKHLLTQENMVEGKPAHFYAAAFQEAQSIYPHGVPKEFAWKWRDGDSPEVDKKGFPYNQRTGYAGHWILTCSTRIPFPVFKYEGAYIQINDGVNAGDYVTVQLSIKAHAAASTTSKPGMYLNPTMLLLSQKGDPIVTASKDPSSGFGDAPPMAASWMVPASTQAPSNFGQFADTQTAQQQMAAPFGSAPGVPQMPQAPVAPAAPHYGTLPQAHQPAAPQFAPHGVPGVPVPGVPVTPMAPAAPQPQGYPGMVPGQAPGVPAAAPGYAPGYSAAGGPGVPMMPGMPGHYPR